MKTKKRELTLLEKPIFLRPSKAEYWQHCTASIHFKGGENPLRDESRAELGSVAHSMFELLIQYSIKHKLFGSPFPRAIFFKLSANLKTDEKKIWESNKTEIMRYAVMVYNRINIDYQFYKKQFKYIHILTEKQMSYKDEAFEIAGTADLILIASNVPYKPGVSCEIHVFDYKTGFIEVDAEHNEQLICYAHLAWWTLTSGNKKVKEIPVTIIQPSTNTISSDTVSVDVNYFKEAGEHVKQKAEYKVGKRCRYCNWVDVCPGFRSEIVHFKQVTLPDGVEVDRLDEWERWLDLTENLKKPIDRVAELIKNFYELGYNLPGYEMTYRKLGRQWGRDISADEVASVLKLKRKALVEEVLKKPKSIEKMLKDEDKLALLETLVFQPSARVLKKTKGE